MKLLLLSLALLLGLGLARVFAQRPAKPELTPTKTLAYVTGGHPRQTLDLYLPEALPGHDPASSPATPPAKLPLVIWIHGGGWESGDKARHPGRFLLERGYAVASLNYRRSSDAVFPAQIEDCKTALRHLRAHAGELGLDPARIGVWGASAGGHLVALLGVTGQTRTFDVGENLDQSSAVQCVVDWFGPTDFPRYGEGAARLFPGTIQPLFPAILNDPGNAIARLLGGPIAQKRELARAASPLYAVTAQAAPFLIMHSTGDPVVPVRQSQTLHAALQAAGVESTLHLIPNDQHGGGEYTSTASQRLMFEFFERHLKPPRRAP